MNSVLRQALTLSLRRCLWLALLVGTFMLAQALIPASMTYGDSAPTLPHQPSRAEVLVERHACWTGDAPDNVDVPGHVVWQHPDGRTVYSARLVGPALDTLFADGNLPGRAIAFCS